MASETSTISTNTEAPRKIPHAPTFIGITRYSSLFNKNNVPNTHESVRSTLDHFVSTSRNSKQILQKILFSCYKDIALQMIGVVARKINRSYLSMITGGGAARYYNQSYMTYDLDVKLFPELLTKFYDPTKFLNGTYKKYIQEEITKHITPEYLYNYLRQYSDIFLAPHVTSIPKIREIYEYITTQVTGVMFSLDNSYIFDAATHRPTSEKNMTALKLFVYLTDVNTSTPNGPFKLVDISMYDPSNEVYSAMMKQYNDLHSDSHPYIPPYISVSIGGLQYNVMKEDFMLYEKEFLVRVYESEPYLREKFNRSIEGLRASDEKKREYTFIGGKTRTNRRKSRKTKMRVKNAKHKYSRKYRSRRRTKK